MMALELATESMIGPQKIVEKSSCRENTEERGAGNNRQTQPSRPASSNPVMRNPPIHPNLLPK
jgi:hypothetical protein